MAEQVIKNPQEAIQFINELKQSMAFTPEEEPKYLGFKYDDLISLFHKMEWRDAELDKPEYSIDVHVWLSEGRFTIASYSEVFKKWYECNSDDTVLTNVVCWMPLLPLPKEFLSKYKPM